MFEDTRNNNVCVFTLNNINAGHAKNMRKLRYTVGSFITWNDIKEKIDVSSEGPSLGVSSAWSRQELNLRPLECLSKALLTVLRSQVGTSMLYF